MNVLDQIKGKFPRFVATTIQSPAYSAVTKPVEGVKLVITGAAANAADNNRDKVSIKNSKLNAIASGSNI